MRRKTERSDLIPKTLGRCSSSRSCNDRWHSCGNPGDEAEWATRIHHWGVPCCLERWKTTDMALWFAPWDYKDEPPGNHVAFQCYLQMFSQSACRHVPARRKSNWAAVAFLRSGTTPQSDTLYFCWLQCCCSLDWFTHNSIIQREKKRCKQTRLGCTCWATGS